MVIKVMDLGVRTVEMQISPHPFLAMGSWVSALAAACLSFHI